MDIEERDILKYLEPPLLEVIGTFNEDVTSRNVEYYVIVGS